MPGSIVPVLSGLTREQLRPVVEALAGEAVTSFGIAEERVMPLKWLERWRGKRTYGIPSFSYATKSGRSRKQSVFVKRTVSDFPWCEEDAYKWLGAAGAPIPRTYGCLVGPNQERILFLERLSETNGDELAFFGDEGNLREFLTMTARFDAIEPAPEFSATLTGCKAELQNPEKWRPALGQIWKESEEGLLGAELKRFCTAAKLRELEALADHTVETIADMPRGLVKADHRLSNVGRRQDTGELLMFDLDNTTIGPRFDAVADFLGGTECIRLYSSGPANMVVPRPGRREEWARHYLAERERAGGTRVGVDELLGETRALWMAHIFHDLKNWPANTFYWWRSESDSDAARREKREAVLRLLGSLLDEARTI